MRMSRWAFLLVGFPFCAGVLALDVSPDRQGSAPPEFPSKLLEGAREFNLAIDVFGDLRGNFAPCSCPLNPLGGFARRMSYWNAFAARFPSATLLRFDAGSMFIRGTATAHIVNRYMLEGTFKSGLDAINLSEWDVPVWQEMADMAAAGLISKDLMKLPLVSANLTSKAPNFPAFQRYVVLEKNVDPLAGKKLRIAVTGVLVDPESRISKADFAVQKAEEAARQLLADLRGKADYFILLTDMSLGEAISLAVLVPGYHLIAFAHNYQAAIDAQPVGNTVVVGPITEGRMLTEIRINVKSGAAEMDMESHVVPLDRTVPDEPGMGELLRRAQAELDKAKK